ELLIQLQGNTDEVTGAGVKTQTITSIKPGDIIGGHYRIEETIGEGGMGCVYRASHTLIDRTVAIKTLHERTACGEVNLQRFKTEAKASAALIHPNLVTIFDFGLVDERIPYLVMEYLDGKSLADHVRDARRTGGRLDILTILGIF